jgi:DNA-binding NarL/FixJ family response regulator
VTGQDAGVIRVVLADDEAVVRVGVRAVLAAAPEVEVVAEAQDGREAVDLVLRTARTSPCWTSGCPG